MCDEVGVDMDSLISGIEQNKSDAEMAKELGVSQKTVKALRERFMTHGIQSIEGQD
ncbi:MAG: helix-turn-helix domain-containing protein [Clostridia bacterium]|nr:helix-turn-helix domain-containing protein [Clostridia bacterium]